MRKISITLLLVLICATSIFAVSAEYIPAQLHSVYKEGKADPYSFNSAVKFFSIFQDNNDVDMHTIRTLVMTPDKEIKYIDLNYEAPHHQYNEHEFSQVKPALTVSLANLNLTDIGLPGLSSFQIGFNLNLSFDALMCRFNSSQMDGLTGSYFVGGAVKYNDVLAIRYGIHHLSSHYGDELLEKYYNYNNYRVDPTTGFAYITPGGEDQEYRLYGLGEYVRDNCFSIGLSVDLPKGFRYYWEFESPLSGAWVRPFIEANPLIKSAKSSVPNPVAAASLNEGFEDAIYDPTSPEFNCVKNETNLKNDGKYISARIHTGLEYNYRILNIANLFAAVDFQAHQDGQTKHQVGMYDSSNPWDLEFTAGGGIEITDQENNHGFRFELFYHYGRTNLQFYHVSTNNLYFGIGIR